MYDQLRMRVCDRIQHRGEKTQTRGERQVAGITAAVDGIALDILEDQVGLPVVVDAGIGQPGNLRMRQPREQARFVPDLIGRVPAQAATVEELDSWRA